MTRDGESLPVTVLIPTIGRPELLRSCLRSIASCAPRPAEILVVDQSAGTEVGAVVEEFATIGARSVRSEPLGVATARNVGLVNAAHEVVAQTDDDCVVAPDWIERAWHHVQQDPRGIVTGRVLPAGDPVAVPSTNQDERPQRFTASRHFSVLYSGNMAGRRSEMLSFGGFDERMRVAASDNDFCYRWLQAGRPMRFEPDLVVWHHDWRSRPELERLYVRYAVGQGMLYAKHLLRGDVRIARFLVRDLYLGLRAAVAPLRHGTPSVPDWQRGILSGLPRGLVEGLRVFGPRVRSR